MTTTKEKIEMLKYWAAILTVLVSLVTGITAHMKNENETIAKASYEELSNEIKKLSENQVALAIDMAKISGQLEGHKDIQIKLAKYQKEKEDQTKTVKPTYGLKQAPKTKSQVEEIIQKAESIETPEMIAAPVAYEPPTLEELAK